MTEDNRQENLEVDRFVMDRIDSVPHLEALLLVWRDRPQAFSVETVAKHLYMKADITKNILHDLVRDNLITIGADSAEYFYQADPTTERLMHSLDETYRKELIRLSRMIHSKPSAALREFARAFRLKKDE